MNAIKKSMFALIASLLIICLSQIIPADENNQQYTLMEEPLIAPSLDTQTGASIAVNSDLPNEFSWKNLEGQDWTTSAKEQGNCGSCWDFAAMGTLEAMINIQKQDPTLDLDLSEQYVLSCLPAAANNYGQGCLGGNPYNAFYCIKDDGEEGNNCNGIITEECFSYYASHNIPCDQKCENWQQDLIPLQDCGYSWPGIDFTQSEDIIKTKIYEHGPVAAGIDCTNDFITWGISHHDPNEYYPYIEQQWNSRLNHLIVIVGWKDDESIPHGGYWICKNSWGTDWGYDGFYNVEYDGMFSGAFISWVSIQTDDINSPPNTPIITGSTDGKTGKTYTYQAITSDPNNDEIYYYFDWGDDSEDNWIGPYNSNEYCEASHTWNEKGTYSIKVKAKDENGLESDWGTLEVSMPRIKIFSIFEWIAQRFPMIGKCIS